MFNFFPFISLHECVHHREIILIAGMFIPVVMGLRHDNKIIILNSLSLHSAVCVLFWSNSAEICFWQTFVCVVFWHVVNLFLTEVSVSNRSVWFSDNSVCFRQQCLFFWQQCLLPTSVCLCLQLVLRALSVTAAHRPVTVPVSTCSHVTTWMARAIARQAGKAVPVTTT